METVLKSGRGCEDKCKKIILQKWFSHLILMKKIACLEPPWEFWKICKILFHPFLFNLIPGQKSLIVLNQDFLGVLTKLSYYYNRCTVQKFILWYFTADGVKPWECICWCMCSKVLSIWLRNWFPKYSKWLNTFQECFRLFINACLVISKQNLINIAYVNAQLAVAYSLLDNVLLIDIRSYLH